MHVIYSEILEQTADSIESLSEEVFACATYQLLERKDDDQAAERTGSLMLYRVKDDSVKKLQHLETNAILDMKWHRQSDKVLLSSADSKGQVHFYTVDDDRLKCQNDLVIDENALCLSVDWFKTPRPEKVAYSMSTGDLVLVQLGESSPCVVESWKGHSLEAWIIACTYENQYTYYSGADDCLLKMWDTRVGMGRACFTSKRHIMGVCSIQAHPTREHIFCSGSYDENVIVWDNRSMKQPLNEFATGGGVWRLKWHPYGRDLILAACMHNGYKVIEYEENLCNPKCLVSYDGHKSLAYGVDWCLGKTISSKSFYQIASCSFYDKLLTVWQVEGAS